MNEIETELSYRALKLLQQIPESQRLLIALAGSPGSGKSTVSGHLVSKINSLAHSEIAQVVTQDGYHYYRSELESFPNRDEAFARRGAPFTFNSEKFLQLVHKLRDPIEKDSTIEAPNFDHALKDPSEGAIVIKPLHRIIIIEGNYTLLNTGYWTDIASLVDERWKIVVDREVVRSRVAMRHLSSGICLTLEEAYERCDNNDMVNAEYIRLNSCVPDVTIESVPEKLEVVG